MLPERCYRMDSVLGIDCSTGRRPASQDSGRLTVVPQTAAPSVVPGKPINEGSKPQDLPPRDLWVP